MTLTCKSIRSQIRPSLPISRNRQAISRITRAPLRTGASRSFSASPSSASIAEACAASTALRIAARASASLASLSRHLQRPRCLALRGKAFFLLRGKALLDPRHRIEHHAGVGIAVALGVFGQKPAAPRSLHEGFADRSIVLLARQRGAC